MASLALSQSYDHQERLRHRSAIGPAGSLPRVPGAPRVRAGPSHRHARRAAGDRGPWVSLPLRATIPEGNTVGQHADVDVGPSPRAPGLRARGHRRIDAVIAGADPRRNGDDYPMTRSSATSAGRLTTVLLRTVILSCAAQYFSRAVPGSPG